ncbi:MAG: Maf family protein [Coriobacteriia bacterium]|nr:Maf family protein [Coriobacteriia bacterium]MDO9108445.1 Maf family protein [Coriobacteriia bacterium]
MNRLDRIVLASASPRRRRLLSWLGLPFESAAVDTPESLDSPLASDPGALAISLAEEKAKAAIAVGLGRDSLLLTFDTIVVLDGDLLGKPKDRADAYRMLRSLSGRTHQVVTGCTIFCADLPMSSFSVLTDVQMQTLSESRIESWMAQGEFMGCAGAYNIEGQVAKVTPFECYQNVAGLPLCHLYSQIRDLPAKCVPGTPTPPVSPCDTALGRQCMLGPSVLEATI